MIIYILSHKNNKQNIYKIIDLQNQTDFWLFVIFIQDYDVYAPKLQVKNTYIMYKNNKFYQIPWDFDLTFGYTFGHPEFVDEYMKIPKYKFNKNGDYVEINKKTPDYLYYYKPKESLVMPSEVNPVSYLLNAKDEKIKTVIKERYKYLRTNAWSEENIMKYIDMYEEKIFNSGAYKRDKERWPIGAYLDNDDEKLKIFKNYVKERIKHSDEFINKL